MKTELAIKIGGQAGDGALAIGDLLAQLFHRMNLNVITYKDFPSQIRLAHTSYTVRTSQDLIQSRPDALDILLAFDQDSLLYDSVEMTEEGIIIVEAGVKETPIKSTLKSYRIPMREMAKKTTGMDLLKNTLALGIVAQLIGIEKKLIEENLKERLKRKGEEIVNKNLQALEVGWKYGESMENLSWQLKSGKKKMELLMTGNEAIALGALVGGCRFFAGYPITPASEILEFMGQELPKYNGVMVQAEDEISAINMAIGASFTGVRSMTATSGPGLALMTEAISFAGMTEIPLVIVHSQRAAPATGMPTKTAQGDLNNVLFAGHGDFPRIVIAPSTPEEAFYYTQLAFNLAEIYQLPVFVLVDQFLSQNHFSTPKLDFTQVKIDRGQLFTQLASSFKRFAFTASGVSPRTIPGIPGGIHGTSGVEHDEGGQVTTDPLLRTKMMQKRMQKLVTARPALPQAKVFGDPSASYALYAFGSTQGAIRETQEFLQKEGINTHLMVLKTLWPFPQDEVVSFAKVNKKIVVIEENITGQLANLIEHALGKKVEKVLKYDGRSFSKMELVRGIKEKL